MMVLTAVKLLYLVPIATVTTTTAGRVELPILDTLNTEPVIATTPPVAVAKIHPLLIMAI